MVAINRLLVNLGKVTSGSIQEGAAYPIPPPDKLFTTSTAVPRRLSVATSERESFMAMRKDVQLWSGDEVSGAKRGTEHAANVIAWGLSEVPFLVSRTYPNDPQSMIASFEHLTGHAPLHDGGEGYIW